MLHCLCGSFESVEGEGFMGLGGLNVLYFKVLDTSILQKSINTEGSNAFLILSNMSAWEQVGSSVLLCTPQ